jgi:cytochrome c553
MLNHFSKYIFIAAAFALFAGTLLIVPMPAAADEIESNIARGGILYDKWFKVIGAEKPSETHPAWPASNTKKKGNATHRCKSCHGWDLMDTDGAYSSGSYQTGITGIRSFEGVDTGKVIAVMKDDTHGYAGKMNDADYMDLALFVTKGQIDMDQYIDRSSKKFKGDIAKGEPLYNTICANCHGRDGLLPKDMKPLGKVVSGNPWEGLHKVMYGQPGEGMPALTVFGASVASDILAYTQTLPQE